MSFFDGQIIVDSISYRECQDSYAMTGRERGVNSALQAGHGQLLWFSKFACDAC